MNSCREKCDKHFCYGMTDRNTRSIHCNPISFGPGYIISILSRCRSCFPAIVRWRVYVQQGGSETLHFGYIKSDRYWYEAIFTRPILLTHQGLGKSFGNVRKGNIQINACLFLCYIQTEYYELHISLIR